MPSKMAPSPRRGTPSAVVLFVARRLRSRHSCCSFEGLTQKQRSFSDRIVVEELGRQHTSVLQRSTIAAAAGAMSRIHRGCACDAKDVYDLENRYDIFHVLLLALRPPKRPSPWWPTLSSFLRNRTILTQGQARRNNEDRTIEDSGR